MTNDMTRDFSTQNAFDREALISCGHGNLFGDNNARLPLPNMLMFDRITSITNDGGSFNRGQVTAELDIKPDLWFFDCHFESDPVMPGCLGLDALWQLLGFFLAWEKNPGIGRALGCGEVKFTGQILPTTQLVTYKLDIKRVVKRGVTMGIAQGSVSADHKIIYQAQGLRVGLFESIEAF